jgi:hypothetical protein
MNDTRRRSFVGENRHEVDLIRPSAPFIGWGGDLNDQEESGRRCRWMIKDFKAPVMEGADGASVPILRRGGQAAQSAQPPWAQRSRLKASGCGGVLPASGVVACVRFPGGRKVPARPVGPKRPSGPKLAGKSKKEI